MEQKRFLIALVLSAVILLGWSYFFVPRTPQQDAKNAQLNTSPTELSQPIQPPAPSVTSLPGPTSGDAGAQVSSDAIAHQTLTVSTPLYKIVFDNRGAVPTSWILKQNQDTGRPLYSIESTRENKLPLELISREGLNRGQSPLHIEIDTPSAPRPVNSASSNNLNDLVKGRNYKIASSSFDVSTLGNGENVELNIASGDTKKQIEFEMLEAGTGLKVVKSFSFDPNSYVVNVAVRVTQQEQAVPGVRMVVGPSIGDQGVPSYTFYSVAPQGLVVGNGDTTRLLATDVHKQKSDSDPATGRKSVDGSVDWASVGDTYFAMALVLPQPTSKVEFLTQEYQHGEAEKEQRFLISGLVPVPADDWVLNARRPILKVKISEPFENFREIIRSVIRVER
jgi:YidC/Oxa1 family membrane protein insertase